ncbi:hypothetical protein BV22DRAFT_1051386 [Leucogyrophana mollusca]|uniref:Uncharacterized protein n=1 Tax=Leucogyrophana mollusca TaxID=85980 RepID=A0ACB8B0N8_9AGAM|nr:hypothetical protein BV22DRAFT_1051386 [Leucogyrophana mollusca]
MSNSKRCLCHANGCVDFEAIDPDTNILSPGRLLHPSTVQRHAQDERIWQRALVAKPKPDVETQILAAALARRDDIDSDPAVTARSDITSSSPYGASKTALLGYVQDNSARSHTGSQVASVAHLTQPAQNSESLPPDKLALQAISEHKDLFRAIVSQYQHPPGGLIFEETPVASSPTTPGPLNYKASAAFIRHQHSIDKVVNLLDQISSAGSAAVTSARKALITEIQKHQEFLDRKKEQDWLQQRATAALNASSSKAPVLIQTDHHFQKLLDLRQIAMPLLACMITAIVLHVLTGLSRTHSNFLLISIRTIVVSACLKIVDDTAKDLQARLVLRKKIAFMAENWPSDIRTALRQFDLDPELVQYVCCQSCHTLYGPTSESTDNQGVSNIPEFCTFQETPSSLPCETRLLDGGGPSAKPLCRYMYQPLQSWLGRLLSRPGIEQSMCTRLGDVRPQMYDTWDGEVFRQFKGPDGKPYFQVSSGASELRLVFSMFIDWFSPWGSKKNGPHTSVGGIYMVCHNLPVHLRYRIENVYIAGIIPGPKEPQLHHLNHLLRPLVDDLLQLWSPGVFLTRTALHNFGCLMKSDIANFDISSWKRRTWEEHKALAIEWRDAASAALRESLFDRHGIRYSELLRLPYWDPTKFSVVESMHNLFLGELQHHCRNILGMDAESLDPTQARIQPHNAEEQQKFLNEGISAIQRGSFSALEKLRRGYIVALAHANNVEPRKPPEEDVLKHHRRQDAVVGKAAYARALIQWYKDYDGVEIRCPVTFPRPVVDLSTAWTNGPRVTLLNQSVLKEVWADMKKTTLPTWMSRAPRNLGCKSHGKLKADQWRTACMVNLVITLCRLWGTSSADPKKKSILQNFLSLVIAVRWATMRSTSNQHIEIVEAYFQYYMKTVVDIFGTACLVANNHLSFHLAECMRGFGPVHGWWAFPFERFNGILQRYNTNQKLGEIELTFIRSFCRGGSLKALMTQDGLPDALAELRPIIHQYFGSDFRGTLLNDLLSMGASNDGSEVPSNSNDKFDMLSDGLYYKLLTRINHDSFPLTFRSFREPQESPALALDPRMQFKKTVKYRGVSFSTAGYHVGNSYILFRSRSTDDIRAGQIHGIFVHSRPGPQNSTIAEFFYVVKQFKALDESQAIHDPYRLYSLLDTRLYLDEFDPEDMVIKTCDITSHFASCPYESSELQRKCRVVVSLDRV